MDVKKFLLELLNGTIIDTFVKEIKSFRKGAMFLIFVFFSMCFILDFFILRNIVSSNSMFWIRQVYAIGLMLSFTILSVKIYNQIADKLDSVKSRLERKANKVTRYQIALRAMPYDSLKLIEQLIKENENVLTLENNYNNTKFIRDLMKLDILEKITELDDLYYIEIEKDFIDFASNVYHKYKQEQSE